MSFYRGLLVVVNLINRSVTEIVKNFCINIYVPFNVSLYGSVRLVRSGSEEVENVNIML